MIRLLADENVSSRVVSRLAAEKFDVIWIATSHAGASDEVVLEIARRETRILVTEDRDFGEMIVRRRFEAPGVVLLELDRLSSDQEAERVVKV